VAHNEDWEEVERRARKGVDVEEERRKWDEDSIRAEGPQTGRGVVWTCIGVYPDTEEVVTDHVIGETAEDAVDAFWVNDARRDSCILVEVLKGELYSRMPTDDGKALTYETWEGKA
jgi:hypothetical protein